jgi:hypothetical protein
VQSGDSNKKMVVLKHESGENVTVPIEEFLENYMLLSGKSSATTEAIKETLNNIRQNSNVRFIALPFFLTVSGVMAHSYKSQLWAQESMLPWFGLGLAFVGLVLEIVLSRNLNCWWEALRTEASSRPWNMIRAHRNNAAVWGARIFLFLPYPAMVFYWSSISFPETWAWAIAATCFLMGVAVWVLAKPAT